MTRTSNESRPHAARPRVVVFEPNPRVLAYTGRTLQDKYKLSLVSDSGALVESLRGAPPCELLLFAYDNVAASAALLEQVRTAAPALPIIVLTCAVDLNDYDVLARLSVSDIVLKPLMENLDETLARQFAQPEEDTGEVQESEIDDSHSFVRSSKRMRDIERQAALVARTEIPVLILGESGTGKEILATYTHKLSQRSKRMFLKINCAAMPAELLESELFGYEEGAFTGATKTRQGKFEICSGGTIFLDEIGEMPAQLQAKLLHVLQDGSFFRLGGRAPLRADVRVIAATNVNIKQSIADKTFREDLYYRLNGLSLVLPPLRERLEELPALAAYFMRKSAARHNLAPLPLTQTFLDGLGQYAWPGNLRELENVITRFLVLQDERAILRDLPSVEAVKATPLNEGEDRGLKDLVRGVKGSAEAVVIAGALERTGWNRKAAAHDLQISYKALLYKIKQYDLAPRIANMTDHPSAPKLPSATPSPQFTGSPSLPTISDIPKSAA